MASVADRAEGPCETTIQESIETWIATLMRATASTAPADRDGAGFTCSAGLVAPSACIKPGDSETQRVYRLVSAPA